MEQNIKKKILAESKNGNIVVATFDGLKIAKLKEIIKQPVDGLLYDINRNESTILHFIKDPKWINDYASTQIIRELKSQLNAKNDNFLPTKNEVDNHFNKKTARKLTTEEINAKIEVLENVGGYSIEVEVLKESLKESKSIVDLENESYKYGYEKSLNIAKLRRNKIVEMNKKLYDAISVDFGNIEEKGELYISDILKMPLFTKENINILQEWFRYNSDI